jgi:hypothetical protein
MNVRGVDSPKILGQRLRHVAPAAGWLPHRHAGEILPSAAQFLTESASSPGRRWEVIEAVQRLKTLRHHGMGRVLLHGPLGAISLITSVLVRPLDR